MIRLARPSDSEDILKIYAPYITDNAVSFETEVPAIDAFSARIENILQQYPFIVYETEGKIAGYAYASRHMERAAYKYDVEVSIYVSSGYHGAGAAYKLYECLFTLLDELGYKNAYACYTEPNEKSRKFHEKFGFTVIGTHHKTGYKFGKWHDVTWIEKTISAHDDNPHKIRSINELSSEYLKQIFSVY